MKAYKITRDQKNRIENTPFGQNLFINPKLDINGHWFVFEEEMNFLATNKSWDRAVLTEFVPAPVDNSLGALPE